MKIDSLRQEQNSVQVKKKQRYENQIENLEMKYIIWYENLCGYVK